ncbi:hypothetical protein FIU82_01795 [Pseudoalteromonas sp. THAF3]|uniref:sce7726 family protein n=1 Tax=unclassified Pseudoalteromonas TaxID=194690 RepID=UPI001267BE70|nr:MULTISPECIES: sce7726 family protein [unclassified Pseudoalteromonas]MCG7566560.1 sce7726 family protein [Pseudoalteromonas sp. CnMc7-15]QFU03750.1 hypothetical protein FIU82_01795 [Pseudoalteromonas sp. THAF3]
MNEIDVRQAVHKKLLKKYRNDGTTLIVDELGVRQGSARVDIAVVNGVLHGFELKSAKDNLNRLPAQVEHFSSVMDKMTLVVADNHLQEAMEIIPSWWGVKVVAQGQRGAIHISTARREKTNKYVDPWALSQLLWHEEILDGLAMCGITKGVKSRPRWVLWEKLAKEMPLDQLKDFVRSTLRARSDWRDT